MNFYHVYSDYDDRESGALRRHHVARMTWGDERLIPLPVYNQDLPRNSRSIGDSRRLPFLRDLFNFATSALADDDWIIFTNDDTCLCVGFVAEITAYAQDAHCFYGHRRDFREVRKPLTCIEIGKGGLYPGIDLFAFKVSWWGKVRAEFPDLIFGCEWWDCVLWQMMKKSGGKEIKDAAYHEQHDAVWCRPDFIRRNIGQIFNTNAASVWFDSNPSPDMVKVGGEWKVK